MNKCNYDIEFSNIINPILTNDEFNKLDMIPHHGTTRLEHSLKVSYYSYKIAKKLKLDYKSTARAGLLHDFFLSEVERTNKEKFLSTFTHATKAVKRSEHHFGINELEEDIIKSHMFPLNLFVPKYMESWIVTTVDKVVAVKEFKEEYKVLAKDKLAYITNISLFILLNLIYLPR
jgi:uncharacterized protein